MGRAYGMYGDEGKCIQDFSEETLRKKKDHWNNIKVDIKETEWKHTD
jgi:hypothetical protein